jgi:Ca-activated chloride channel family protein
MVKFISTGPLSTKLLATKLLANKCLANKKALYAFSFIVLALVIYAKPQQFLNLWFTADQQGQFLFDRGEYKKASSRFTHTEWKAYSSYGAEAYKNAASFYSQYPDLKHKLAQANAIAHSREYVDARNLYQKIINETLEASSTNNNEVKKAAETNIKIVQAIIDGVNRMSDSQKAEGESKELGDEPQTGDGAETKELPPQEIEQLTAEQLLLDPKLNEMWLRQVQKDPSQFLSQKFYMQLEKQKKDQALIQEKRAAAVSTDGAKNDQ